MLSPTPADARRSQFPRDEVLAPHLADELDIRLAVEADFGGAVAKV